MSAEPVAMATSMEGIKEEKERGEKEGYDPLKWLARENEESKPKRRLVVYIILAA